jgi:hypothetical protein
LESGEGQEYLTTEETEIKDTVSVSKQTDKRHKNPLDTLADYVNALSPQEQQSFVDHFVQSVKTRITQPFEDSTRSTYEQLAETSIDLFLKHAALSTHNDDGFLWRVEFSKPDIDLIVLSSEVAGSSFLRFKAVCTIPATTPKAMHMLSLSPSVSKALECSFGSTCSSVPVPGSPHLTVVTKSYREVGLLPARDSISLICTHTFDDGGILEAQSGLDLPMTPGLNRVRTLPGSGRLFESCAEGTKITYMIHRDTGSPIDSIVEDICVEFSSYFDTLIGQNSLNGKASGASGKS